MKMMSNTSRTSISGVTFISQVWPRFWPVAIPIKISFEVLLCSASRRRLRGGRRKRILLLFHIGQQAQIVHPGGTNVVHHLNHPLVICTCIGAEIDDLVGAV